MITLKTFQMVRVRIYDPPHWTLSHVQAVEEEILLVAIATSILAGGVGL